MCDLPFRSGRAALAALVVVSSTAACSGSDDDDDSSTVQCSSLQPDQIVAASVEYDGAPEPVTGGSIQEGSYHLTSFTAYIPSDSTALPNCNALADGLVLSNGGFEHAVGCYFEADNPETLLGQSSYAGSYFLSGTNFSFNYTCPSTLVETFAYSAEPGNLRMLVSDASGSLTSELVWTLE